MSSTVVGRALGILRLEVLPSEEVRDQATRLLRVNALRAADNLQRAADSLQVAAARIKAGPTARAELVTYDERLALAAGLEGFRVLQPGPWRG